VHRGMLHEAGLRSRLQGRDGNVLQERDQANLRAVHDLQDRDQTDQRAASMSVQSVQQCTGAWVAMPVPWPGRCNTAATMLARRAAKLCDACGDACGKSECHDPCFDPCACQDLSPEGSPARPTRPGDACADDCKGNACGNAVATLAAAATPALRPPPPARSWEVRCVTEQSPAQTNVTRMRHEKVAYTVCKKVHYNETRNVPYTVRRQGPPRLCG